MGHSSLPTNCIVTCASEEEFAGFVSRVHNLFTLSYCIEVPAIGKVLGETVLDHAVQRYTTHARRREVQIQFSPSLIDGLELVIVQDGSCEDLEPALRAMEDYVSWHLV